MQKFRGAFSSKESLSIFFVYNFISLLQNLHEESAYCMQLNSSFATKLEEMKFQF
jgi:hypothetical protein